VPALKKHLGRFEEIVRQPVGVTRGEVNPPIPVVARVAGEGDDELAHSLRFGAAWANVKREGCIGLDLNL
jgi:hypothetical protein